MITWDEICEDKNLRDLPFKIELDRWGRIIMSPVKPDHSELQAEIAHLLRTFLPDWSILVECAVDTSEGTRAADVAAMTADARSRYRGVSSLPCSPEICVEVLSDGNTDEEMVEKRRLLAEKGCVEFWTCGPSGMMAFRKAADGSILAQSILCPRFPVRVETGGQ